MARLILFTSELFVEQLRNRKSSDRIRAAQYVRMSTEHQKYSTENQAEVIRRYADGRGFEVGRIYEDSGKSGLRLQGRDALRRLINEVQNGAADFNVVLVYDVSRAGINRGVPRPHRPT